MAATDFDGFIRQTDLLGKLSDLLAAIGLFELKKDGKSSYVRALPKKNR